MDELCNSMTRLNLHQHHSSLLLEHYMEQLVILYFASYESFLFQIDEHETIFCTEFLSRKIFDFCMNHNIHLILENLIHDKAPYHNLHSPLLNNIIVEFLLFLQKK